jgi:hypothetical protein
MRIGRKDITLRLNSMNFPTILGSGGGGATWTYEPSERSRAASILRFIEDRRVLYNIYEAEMPEACIRSVKEIREHLRTAIEQCDSAELRDPLRAIQAACRQFLTDTDSIPERIFGSRAFHDGPVIWGFNQALGALRVRVGHSVVIVIERFNVDVDEHLSAILPPQEDNPG